MFSAPAVSAWSYAEQFRLLVNCGDGVATHIETWRSSMGTIALNSDCSDHIGGLLHFLNMFDRGNQLYFNSNFMPTVLFPYQSKLVSDMQELLEKLFPHKAGSIKWIPAKPGGSYRLYHEFFFEFFETDYLDPNGLVQAIGYKVIRPKKKTRTEYVGRDLNISNLARNIGDDLVFKKNRNLELAFCRAGIPKNPEDISGVNCLVLECTDVQDDSSHGFNNHQNLAKIHKFVCETKPKRLVISHFYTASSPWYIQSHVDALEWPCPVEVVMRGQVLRLPKKEF